MGIEYSISIFRGKWFSAIPMSIFCLWFCLDSSLDLMIGREMGVTVFLLEIAKTKQILSIFTTFVFTTLHLLFYY